MLLYTVLDDLVEATTYYTTARDEGVLLRTDDTGPAAMKPFTVQTMFKRTVEKCPHQGAIGMC